MPAAPALRYATVDSPLGPIVVVADADGLKHVGFDLTVDPDWRHTPGLDAAQQLTEYFAGVRQAFELPLAPVGTAFQQDVWRALVHIPFGETTSYGAIAQQLGRPDASRAVGAANGANPLAIVVPCHRVVGSDGTLTGYAGGLARKKWLLEHERGAQRLL